MLVARREVIRVNGLGHGQQEVISRISTSIYAGEVSEDLCKFAKVVDEPAHTRGNDIPSQNGPPCDLAKLQELVAGCDQHESLSAPEVNELCRDPVGIDEGT